MSILAIDAGTTGVTAVVVTPDGRIAGQGLPGVPPALPAARLGRALRRGDLAGHPRGDPRRAHQGRPDRAHRDRHHQPARDRRALGPRDARLARAARSCGRTGVRPTSASGCAPTATRTGSAELTGLRLDPYFSGTKLMWLAEHEPHTWALVESGRYAVGTVDSYLIARMTRGTWHVTDVSNASRTLLFDLESGDWSDELCELFGVPRDALPELVPNWGEIAPTDPSVFLGLSLPDRRASPATSSRRSSARPASRRASPSAPTAPARSSSPTPAPAWCAATPACCRRRPGAPPTVS